LVGSPRESRFCWTFAPTSRFIHRVEGRICDVHFQSSDYVKLTIIGVVAASAAWPIVTRLSSAPRWLYFRLAIIVTIVLLAQDAWILLNGAPGKGGGYW
jgi:hypothetical protein